MKKILLLLLTVLTFTSCVETYRSDDIFVVTKKEMRDTQYQYKYLYHVNHYSTSTRKGLYYKTYYHFVSNDNYELGDTIRFIRYASNER